MNQLSTDVHSDFLVIGSGLAGLYSAFYASKFGEVSVVTKSTLEQSNSYWAQGGIAAAIDPDDSHMFHSEDTLKAGRGLCNSQAVDILVREGIQRVLSLMKLGMKFDIGEQGFHLGMEGGHSKRRVLQAGGTSTGKEIVSFLINEIKKSKRIKVYENTQVLKIISESNKCCGGIAVNYFDNNTYSFISKSTIIATGGASALFERSTNPPGATGEGIALAFNEGAEVMDMEFIQFHPTSFYSESGNSFLLSEALRGEGAILLNDKGQRFMKPVHKNAELAPRDVVASAIFREIRKSQKPYVYLSVKHLDSALIKEKFNNIYQFCLSQKLDITTEDIPVAPAAHYFIGGIKTGLMGQTNIDGLYACGEVASNGVHGANRLASNSLLECLVFSKRAVDHAKVSLKSKTIKSFKADLNLYKYQTSEEQQTIYLDAKNKISQIMNDYLGIIRKEEELHDALKKIENLEQITDKLSSFYSIQLKNIITVCALITKSALLRQESRGAHIREKFPKES
nr:L-aspartate oxidase [Candidatus Dadabacteria bacterium]NIS08060.1 L-aspartate oxidase [Candidatus Dadabacteria bacterium]NIV42308.1 L-aspartate oxidase [Candidatus Dadabacteria bacterium]NIX14803.1 L-aspartate oxidase [Candidatus Dadabacteria bacterium]NIY21344.1 L-aspartate oxidase [Candidatus Dadabacteria bacterium]